MRSINDLVELANTPKARGKGKFALDAESEKRLDEFVEWLMVVETKTKATSQSYRSYVAKALCENPEWDEMTSDMRSGVRAFARFTEDTSAS